MAVVNGRQATQAKNSLNLLTGSDGQIPQYLINGVPADAISYAGTLGYEFLLDDEYPDQENGFNITAGVWTRLPNNGAVQIGNLPDGVPSFYDASEQKYVFDQPNSIFIIDVLFSIVPAASNATVQLRSFVDSQPTPFLFLPPSPRRLEVNAGVNSPQVIPTDFSVSQNTFDNGVYYEVLCSADATMYQIAYQALKLVQK